MKKTFGKGIFKTLLTSAVILGSVASPAAAFAQSYDELIGETQWAIDSLSAEQSALYADLAVAYTEIEALHAEVTTLLEGINEDDELIFELETEVAELESLIEKRQALIADQARNIQMNGGTSNYLNVVASSDSISDFVGRLDVVRKMVTANKDLLDVQKDDKTQVEENKEVAESTKEEKVEKKVELEAIKSSLEENVVQAEVVYEQLTNDISLAASNRDALIAEKAAFEEAQRIAAEQAAAAQAQAEAIAAAQAEAQAQAEAAAAAVAQAEADAWAAAEAQAAAEAAAQAAADAVVEAPVAEEVPVVEVPVVEAPVVEEVPAVEVPVVEQPDTSYDEAQAAAEAAAAAQAAAEAEAQAQAEAAAQAAAEAEAAAQAAKEKAEASQNNANSLLANAAQYLGTPYVWGGKSPSGFDCSGFVQYVFQETYGKDIGGWTGAQENAGSKIGVSEAQAGDLYFWGSQGSTYHVAIATGGGDYIHASQPGTPLEYNSVSSYFMPSFALRVN